MPKDGKEPAGLRRWRLAQKRKHAPRKARMVTAMARRKSYGRAAPRRRYVSRRAKETVSIGAALGAIIYGANTYSSYAGYSDKSKFWSDMVPVAFLTGYDVQTKKLNKEYFAKGGGPILIGTIGGAIASKLPFIRSAPRKIPLVGRYLRW